MSSGNLYDLKEALDVLIELVDELSDAAVRDFETSGVDAYPAEMRQQVTENMIATFEDQKQHVRESASDFLRRRGIET